MINRKGFSRPPLSIEEKEEKEREFLNFDKIKPLTTDNEVRKVKEATKAFLIRAPESYWRDIEEIVNHTGISKNAVCLELLRPAIKKRLKELKEN